ncbi:MAG: hypothetical protein ACW99G_06110 [Candidatus Thorarchaeota archaeon]|jgi:hypothetical protein
MDDKIKKDAIVTWASGDSFCKLPEFHVFLESIRRLNMPCDKIILTLDMPEEVREKVLYCGFEIHDVQSSEKNNVILRDRLLGTYRWLIKEGYEKYNRVLLTDSKDVVFQSDPFDLVRGAGEYVLLCSEGGKQYQSQWNAQEQIKIQANRAPHAYKFSQNPILNSGFIIGTYNEIKNLSLLLWSNTVPSKHVVTDQATLNYLHPYLLEDPTYYIAHPIVSSLCVTGEGVKEGWLEVELEFIDGKLYHPFLKKPYCAFHQWERTKYKEQIFEVYST